MKCLNSLRSYGSGARRTVALLLVLFLAVSQLVAWPWSKKGPSEEELALQAQLEMVLQEKEELTLRLTSLEPVLTELEAQLAKSNKNLRALQEDSQISETAVEEAKTLAKTLSEKMTSLQKDLETSEKALASMEKKYNQTQEALEKKSQEAQEYYKMIPTSQRPFTFSIGAGGYIKPDVMAYGVDLTLGVQYKGAGIYIGASHDLSNPNWLDNTYRAGMIFSF